MRRVNRVINLSVIIFVIILVLIMSSLNVQAFGISYPNLENGTLNLYPNQTYLYKLVVQNKDPEDMRALITLESSIATLVGNPEIDVPGKTFDNAVFFNITIPLNAQIGDTYNINYKVSPIGRGEGQIPLAVAYDKNFKVLVVEKPKEAVEEQPAPPPPKKPLLPNWAFIPLIIIVLLAVLILLWRKSHQVSERLAPEQSKPLEQSTVLIQAPEALEVPEAEPETGPETEPAVEVGAASTAPYALLESFEREEKAEKVISPHHYFHLRNGQSLKNLEELYSAIKVMSSDDFNHHVNSDKNDFANWVAHVLGEEELAGKLRAKPTKEAILELIKNEFDKTYY
jgi:hypothetical protein